LSKKVPIKNRMLILQFSIEQKITVDNENSPPIPPKPRTNWLPSCDLSVMISNVAPKVL